MNKSVGCSYVAVYILNLDFIYAHFIFKSTFLESICLFKKHIFIVRELLSLLMQRTFYTIIKWHTWMGRRPSR